MKPALHAYAASLLFALFTVAFPQATASDAAQGARRYTRIEGTDGVPLNVVEVGNPSNPAIVMIHGIGQSHSSFDAQLDDPALAAEFHLVAFDLRGHGQSGKPWTRESYVTSAKWAEDLARVIEATNAGKAVLLGWSYGSLVVADYIRKYGTSNLAGIALVGAYGGLTDPPTGSGPPSAALVAQMNRTREEQMSGDPAVRAAAVHRGALRLTAKAMPAEWLAKADAMGMLAATEARRYMFDRPLENKELVTRIDVPFLLFIGGRDGNTPETQGRELAGKVRDGRVLLHPEAGHSPFAEDPARFNRELANFARATRGSR